MRQIANTVSCIAAILFGSGCIAFNVGDKEVREKLVWTKVKTETEVLSKTLSKIEATHAVEADVPARINRVSIALSGNFRNNVQDFGYRAKVRIETQRKMSFGLWPCFAEKIWRPSGTFVKGEWIRLHMNPSAPKMGVPFAWLLGATVCSGCASVLIPYTTFVVPFYGSYEGAGDDVLYGFVPFGFHRYAATKVTNLPSCREAYGSPRTYEQEIKATGPFRVWLGVPSLSYSGTQSVARDETEAVFALPMGVESQLADIEIRFLFPDTDGETGFLTPDSRAILENAVGTRYVGQIKLTGAPPLVLAQPQTSFVTITNVIVEKVVVSTSPIPPKAPYDIVTKEPYSDGRATFLVIVKDETKTKPEIANLARPEIERILRDAFMVDNSGSDESRVRVHVVPDFGHDEKTFTMRGRVAYSKPTVIDWRYDSEVKTGKIRLLVPAGMDADVAKDWARRNIEAIVADKSVAIEVGKAPPPGAKYKILADSMEDGVLVIVFKVVD